MKAKYVTSLGRSQSTSVAELFLEDLVDVALLCLGLCVRCSNAMLILCTFRISVVNKVCGLRFSEISHPVQLIGSHLEAVLPLGGVGLEVLEVRLHGHRFGLSIGLF